nr:uncharacterized protein CTRU02_05606 [Colletotrichum truncatum]KAF6794049.1 hypothetical protein CTRU02_05606 [Colletotrichum truncatum]
MSAAHCAAQNGGLHDVAKDCRVLLDKLSNHRERWAGLLYKDLESSDAKIELLASCESLLNRVEVLVNCFADAIRTLTSCLDNCSMGSSQGKLKSCMDMALGKASGFDTLVACYFKLIGLCTLWTERCFSPDQHRKLEGIKEDLTDIRTQHEDKLILHNQLVGLNAALELCKTLSSMFVYQNAVIANEGLHEVYKLLMKDDIAQTLLKTTMNMQQMELNKGELPGVFSEELLSLLREYAICANTITGAIRSNEGTLDVLPSLVAKLRSFEVSIRVLVTKDVSKEELGSVIFYLECLKCDQTAELDRLRQILRENDHKDL